MSQFKRSDGVSSTDLADLFEEAANGTGRRQKAAGLSLLLGALLAGVGAITVWLRSRWNVNWDEFHYLSYVYDLERDSLQYRWATFHVHLFSWLTELSGDEVDQILVARSVMVLLSAATAGLIFRVACRLVSREAALVAVLAYVSFTFVIRHGISFRPDPLCAFLLVAAVDLVLPPWRRFGAFFGGLATALSLLISVKASFHAALIGAVLILLAWYSPMKRSQVLSNGAMYLLGLASSFIPLVILHGRFVEKAAAAEQGRVLLGAVAGVFGTGRLFPGYAYWIASIQENLATWLLLLAGLAITLARAIRLHGAERGKALIVLAFAAPLSSIVVYRNAFPYFYVFILPLAVLCCSVAAHELLERSRRSARLIWKGLVVAMSLAMFSEAVVTLAENSRDQTVLQRQLLHVIHRVFPEPVAYIDRCSMVSSFPKVGFFMSTLGVQRYRQMREPIMEDLLRESDVAFLISNTPSLRLDLPVEVLARGPVALVREDIETLRSNFIPHWGPLFVRGKSFAFDGVSESLRFEMMRAGEYTVESNGTVVIDGQEWRSGDVLELTAGWHEISARGAARFARLRWGARLPMPSFPPVRGVIFTSL